MEDSTISLIIEVHVLSKKGLAEISSQLQTLPFAVDVMSI